MSAKYWLKLYYEILDDYKMGKLSRSLRYRVIEMFCLAGETDEAGYLPSLEKMAWKLREQAEVLESDLIELAKVGILDQRDGKWFVVNFAKRQAPSDAAERMREFRKRTRYELVTKSNASYAPDTEEDTDTEEGEKLPLPTNALEASVHPDIKLFHKVSGVFPGIDDYKVVIDSITYLRKTHPNEDEFESYLLPFWLAWDARKTKDGQPFKKTNVSWLAEWAVNNAVPSFSKNGTSETKTGERVNLTALRLQQEK